MELGCLNKCVTLKVKTVLDVYYTAGDHMSTYHTLGDGRESPCSKVLEHANARQDVDWPLPYIMPAPGKGLKK
jgi:hypothetical protein